MTTLPANDDGATTIGRVAVRATLNFAGQLTADLNNVPTLMRVSPVYEPAEIDANGRPVDGALNATDVVYEPWGHLAVFINDKDVTYLRDVPTTIESMSWQRLGNYETASLVFPGISVFETFGTGDLDWLNDHASVRITRIDSEGGQHTVWLGSVNAIVPTEDSLGIRITAHGPLYDANYRVATPPVRSTDANAIQDLGADIAKTLNAVRGKHSAVQAVTTGALAAVEPSWDKGLDYIKNLLSMAVTDAGDTWTVWIDNTRHTTISKISDLPGTKTVTVVSGQDGVEESLTADPLTGITTIYGQGVTAAGAAWQNTQYPAATTTVPRYPLDDPDTTIGEGATDGLTASGDGITKLQERLNTLGYLTIVSGNYNKATATSVSRFQKAKGLPVTGIINLTTWNRLFGKRNVAKGAWIAPLATLTHVEPRLYDAVGKDIGPNPAFDPTARRLEEFIDFGNGISLAQAKRQAQAVLNRDGGTHTEGTVALTVCPQETSRFDIMPGDHLVIKAHHGADLSLIIHHVEWNLSDVPTVTLTVSTRDMDVTELDAAINRNRTSVLKRQKASQRPNSVGTGIGANTSLTGAGAGDNGLPVGQHIGDNLYWDGANWTPGEGSSLGFASNSTNSVSNKDWISQGATHYFRVAQAGYVSQIAMYVTGTTSGGASVGIYADNGSGMPGQRVAMGHLEWPGFAGSKFVGADIPPMLVTPSHWFAIGWTAPTAEHAFAGVSIGAGTETDGRTPTDLTNKLTESMACHETAVLPEVANPLTFGAAVMPIFWGL
jgi:hypothetical protein